VLWGPQSAGKTVFLAQLYTATLTTETNWKIHPKEEKSLEFIQEMRKTMNENNVFPRATPQGIVEQMSFFFKNEKLGIEAVLSLEDRAGKDFEEFKDDAQKRLQHVDGLILIYDPLLGKQNLLMETIEKIHLMSNRGVGLDNRPYAVCISKADILIESMDDYLNAKNNPDSFVRLRLDSKLIKHLDQHCSNYKFFPVSSAGLCIRYGAFELTVFYDENLKPRICSSGRPFNLLEPFAWVARELKEE
jgi:hypothetical protein